MKLNAIPCHLRRFFEQVDEAGFSEALRLTGLKLLLKRTDGLPLARVDPAGLFATDVEAIHEREKMEIRASSLMFDASQVETTYPLAFEWNGRFMRHAFLPAVGESRGLVVLFHGHNAFLHMGPVRPWEHFDLLAPWDTFGWKRQGSWFWGEKGDGFVADMLQALIASYRDKTPDKPWFCFGGSMGGFGALLHGIKYGSDGTYVMCPQVDLAAKIADYGGDVADNPYAYLQGDNQQDLPDLTEIASNQDRLPPLFLVQNQFDHVNPFAEHALPLVEIYNRRKAWCGLRVHPSVGHGGDGKQEEAEMFFSLILDKRPPGKGGS